MHICIAGGGARSIHEHRLRFGSEGGRCQAGPGDPCGEGRIDSQGDAEWTEQLLLAWYQQP